MRSAFIKGVNLLNESDFGVGKHPRPMEGPSSPTADTKGFSEIPKDVTLLQPVISKLVDKVAWKFDLICLANTMQSLPKGVSQEWISTAKKYVNWVKLEQLQRTEKWEYIVEYLEDEMASVDLLISEIEQQKWHFM